jgi:hypothetical protein
MAERGKWAEAEVRDVLTDLEKELLGFTFNRIPDAKGGWAQPAAADFQWFYDTGVTVALDGWQDNQHALYTRNGIIEVKEVEHLTLLPHKNFSPDKIARAWKRKLAGCEDIVLVAHKLKGMRKPQVTWRFVPLKFFNDTTYVKGVASWDLSKFPIQPMEQTLRVIIKEGMRWL